MSPESRINSATREQLVQDYLQHTGDYSIKSHARFGHYLETRTGQVVLWQGNTVRTVSPSQYLSITGAEFDKGNYTQYENNQALLNDLEKALEEREVSSMDTEGPKCFSEPEEQWLRFYSREGICNEQCPFSYDQIMAMDEQDLVNHHQYIQLLFPNPHTSKYNPHAPTLTRPMIEEINHDPDIQDNISDAMDLMLEHWGIERSGRHFALTENAPHRLQRWLTANNTDDQLRISRVLTFFYLCGAPKFATELCLFLQDARRAEGIDPNPYWFDAIEYQKSPDDSEQPAPETSDSPLPEPPSGPLPAFQIKNRAHYQPCQPCEYSIPIQDTAGKLCMTTVTTGNYDRVAQHLALYESHESLSANIDNKATGSAWGAVRFYDQELDQRLQQNNYYLTNTYIHRDKQDDPVCFTVNGRAYPSVEHYFQCMKFLASPAKGVTPEQTEEVVQHILSAPRGSLAKDIARDRKYRDLIDLKHWESIKQQIMIDGIYAKFSQLAELKQRLLNTFPNILIEHTPKEGKKGYDPYWGNSGDDSGHNMTGQMLGVVRQVLGQEQSH
ncbi:NADAR domain-containing protein [Parendozoicomonas haliclonae]|uniref:Swarming motility protein YbiA n=1 Tax=Parendozoicomonas haliclonae TaxID=1960125 RepID=A0A1X7ANZ6_9GAMM|nr:NADAR domain-containing protein [Parendozoicomonas haliclonae]SMA50006.1 Swarming motility protein YbiA [Parendozoicomonas haliclonae]